MERGQRVKHEKFGLGYIKQIMFKGKLREMYIVEFDKADKELHNCMGFTKDGKGYFCMKTEVEIYEE